MVKSLLTTLSCLLLLTINLTAKNGFTEIKNQADWEATLQNAKTHNKLILMDFYTSWCGYCKMMDRDVFSDKKFQKELAENYISVKLNAESAFGSGFAKQNNVSGYPTFVFFDGTGKTVGKVEGYQPIKDFRQSTQRIFTQATKSDDYQRAFKKGKLSPQEMAEYYIVTRDETIRQQIYAKLMDKLSDEELLSGEYASFIKVTANTLDRRTTKVMLQNKSTFIENHGEEAFTSTTAQLFNNTLLSAIESGDESILTRMENELIPYFIDESEEIPLAKLIMRKLYFSGRQDWSNYRQLIESEWKKNPEDNQVYNEAFTLTQEFSHDPEALALASDWLTPEAKANPNLDNYMLLAIIEAIRGNMDLATQHVSSADSYASTEEEKGRVAELKAKITESIEE